jgi:hypothetical protein
MRPHCDYGYGREHSRARISRIHCLACDPDSVQETNSRSMHLLKSSETRFRDNGASTETTDGSVPSLNHGVMSMLAT